MTTTENTSNFPKNNCLQLKLDGVQWKYGNGGYFVPEYTMKRGQQNDMA